MKKRKMNLKGFVESTTKTSRLSKSLESSSAWANFKSPKWKSDQKLQKSLAVAERWHQIGLLMNQQVTATAVKRTSASRKENIIAEAVVKSFARTVPNICYHSRTPQVNVMNYSFNLDTQTILIILGVLGKPVRVCDKCWESRVN